MLKEVGFWCEPRALRHSASTAVASTTSGEKVPLLQHAVSLAPHVPEKKTQADELTSRPDPTLLVDHTWYLTNGHFVKMLEWYLVEGAFVESHELAYSYCRFPKCREALKTPKIMGACTLTDGVYVWPEGYAHYVRVHHVRPPQDFVDHVTTHYRRALLATRALSREFGNEVLFLWDPDRRLPVPMPSGMQQWILTNTTVHLPGQGESQTPDERKPWARLMPTCCESCTIS